jgi:hypothetical protein
MPLSQGRFKMTASGSHFPLGNLKFGQGPLENAAICSMAQSAASSCLYMF